MDLKRLKEITDRATNGPWVDSLENKDGQMRLLIRFPRWKNNPIRKYSTMKGIKEEELEPILINHVGVVDNGCWLTIEDAKFIATARTYMPILIEIVENAKDCVEWKNKQDMPYHTLDGKLEEAIKKLDVSE